MKASFLFVNLILTLFIYSACASSKVVEAERGVSPIIRAEAQSQKYNMQFDFMKHHFSGMLIVRRLPKDEIRIVGTTYFGLSLFDFSLRDDTFSVNSCMEPLRKKKTLQLLEADFRSLLLPPKHVRIRQKDNREEERASGKGFGKSKFHLSEFVDEHPERIRVRHPWLRLSIQLDRLKENE